MTENNENDVLDKLTKLNDVVVKEALKKLEDECKTPDDKDVVASGTISLDPPKE